MLILKASISSATTSLIAYWLLVFPLGIESYGVAGGLAVATFISLIFWVASFTISFLCLLPLCAVFEFTSRLFSFLSFALVGFLLPACAQLQFWAIGFHGNIAPIYTAGAGNLFIGALFVGLVGLAGAISAWLCLHIKRAPNKLNQAGTPHSGAPV